MIRSITVPRRLAKLLAAFVAVGTAGVRWKGNFCRVLSGDRLPPHVRLARLLAPSRSRPPKSSSDLPVFPSSCHLVLDPENRSGDGRRSCRFENGVVGHPRRDWSELEGDQVWGCLVHEGGTGRFRPTFGRD